MRHYTYFIGQQETPETDAPFVIIKMTVDEVRERVFNTTVESGIKTREEAEVRLRLWEKE